MICRASTSAYPMILLTGTHLWQNWVPVPTTWQNKQSSSTWDCTRVRAPLHLQTHSSCQRQRQGRLLAHTAVQIQAWQKQVPRSTPSITRRFWNPFIWPLHIHLHTLWYNLLDFPPQKADYQAATAHWQACRRYTCHFSNFGYLRYVTQQKSGHYANVRLHLHWHKALIGGSNELGEGLLLQ